MLIIIFIEKITFQLITSQRQMCNYGDHEINYYRRFLHCGTYYLFSFSYRKITLFEKKYVIKLITLISMYHLKPLVSLQKIKMQMYKLLLVFTLFRSFS